PLANSPNCFPCVVTSNVGFIREAIEQVANLILGLRLHTGAVGASPAPSGHLIHHLGEQLTHDILDSINLEQSGPVCRLHVRGADLKGTSSDRKSTRLNSSHDQISYAVFCLKKKN